MPESFPSSQLDMEIANDAAKEENGEIWAK